VAGWNTSRFAPKSFRPQVDLNLFTLLFSFEMSALTLTSLRSVHAYNFCAFAVFFGKDNYVRINYKTSRFKQKQTREKFAMHI
jgi:hypothetical protein